MKINGLMYKPLSFMIERDVHLLIKDVLTGLTVQSIIALMSSKKVNI